MLKSQEQYGIFGYDAEQEETRKKKMAEKKREMLFWIGSLLLSFAAACVFFVQAWFRVTEHPRLSLPEDTVILGKGDPFDAMRYVHTDSSGKGTLILPEEIDTSSAGNKAAVYRLQYGKREIVRTLLVKVEEKAGSD
ncbi:MAG: hypothetical protein IKG53_06220 [Solobacterium sp.]|nr:hypothetical protein [Solobacterium sp.]